MKKTTLFTFGELEDINEIKKIEKEIKLLDEIVRLASDKKQILSNSYDKLHAKLSLRHSFNEIKQKVEKDD